MTISSLISSRHGFLLPAHQQNTVLSHPLLSSIQELGMQLPRLLKNHQLRDEINRLNREWLKSNNDPLELLDQLAMCELPIRFLTQGYIFETPTEPSTIIPEILAQTNYWLSKQYSRFPILTYSDYVLKNWRALDTNQMISLETVEPIYTFTNSRDEKWFILIHLTIEALSGKAITAAIACCELAMPTPDQDILYQHINEISTSLTQATSLLGRMQEECDPAYYWESLRPYLNGWDKITHAYNHTKGVEFQGVSIHGRQARFAYKGPSGAQSSILPALDAALGIHHDIDEIYQTLLTFQHYMPSHHQLLIHYLHHHSLGNHIANINSNEITSVWRQAIHALTTFRKAHLQLIQTYIFQPTQAKGIDKNQISGTGGTGISNYLENRYTSTHLAQ